MTHPKPIIRVKVAPTNPGHFFACCGLLELADRLWPGAEGSFQDETFLVTTDVPLLGILESVAAIEPDEITVLPSGLPVKPLIAPIRLQALTKPGFFT